MYPDVMTTNGAPDVALEDVAALGYNLVTVRYLELGAMYGMVDFGCHVVADGSTVYPDAHPFYDVSLNQRADLRVAEAWWLQRGQRWRNLGPATALGSASTQRDPGER